MGSKRAAMCWIFASCLALADPALAQDADRARLEATSAISGVAPRPDDIPLSRPGAGSWAFREAAVPELSLLSQPSYFAQAGIDYVGLQGSLVFPDIWGHGIAAGWSTSVALGRRLGDRLSAELELGYRNNSDDQLQNWFHDTDNRGIESFSTMFNLTLHPVRAVRRLRPYLGAGVGVSTIDGDLQGATTWWQPQTPPAEFHIADVALAYQWYAGTAFRLGSRVEVYSEFRYHKTGEFNLTNGYGLPLSIHKLSSPSVVWGLRIATY